jgi:hypothetical protein
MTMVRVALTRSIRVERRALAFTSRLKKPERPDLRPSSPLVAAEDLLEKQAGLRGCLVTRVHLSE